MKTRIKITLYAEEGYAADSLRQLANFIESQDTLPQEFTSTRAEAKITTVSQLFRNWTNDETVRLTEEYASGMSVPDIAVEHDRTEGAIISRLRKLNLIKTAVSSPSLPSNHGKPYTDEEIDSICMMFEQGESVGEIARATGRTARAISIQLQKKGLVEAPEEQTA